ncbi:MAG: GAF domain-containing protein [Candidatus Rokubacteria bacterium]|nr:GAF domain-containing protein [Candidatus Rokubacteria bacterium]
MRLTIRTKLAVLVLAVLLPLLAAAAFKFWSDLSEGRRLAHQNQLDVARLVAAQLDEVLSGETESLLALASFRTLDRIQDSDLEALAVRVRVQHPFMHRFVAAGVDGRVLAASGPRVPEATFIARDVLDAVLRRGEPEVTAPQRSSTDQRQVVLLMVPVQDRRGRIVGVVGAGIDLETLSRYLTALPLSRGQSVAIVAPGGAVLARSASPDKFFDRHLGGVPEAGPLLRRTSGTAEWTSPSGAPHLAGAAGMDRAAWLVMAAVPSRVAYSPAAGRFKRDLLGLGAATMVALLVAWLIGNRMHGSVRALIRGTRDLESAQGPPITVSTGDELAELAEHFNRALQARRQAQMELDARQRRLRALADVNAALSQQLDLEPLLKQITLALAQLTGARNVVFWEVDAARGCLVRRAWSSDPSISADDLPSALPFDKGGTGWVASHRQALFIEDVTRDPRIQSQQWAAAHGLFSFVGVPVVSGDDLLGVLTLNLPREDLPAEDDREILTSFASQAAVAVRNARLFAEATRRRREAEELADGARMLTESLDISEVADRVVKSVLPIFGVDSAGLRLLRPDGTLEAIAWTGPAAAHFKPGHVIEPGIGLAVRVIAEGRAVSTSDIFADPALALTDDLRLRLEQSGTRALLAVPLRAKGELIGVLLIASGVVREFSDADAALLQAFADQAALAMENARLYGEATRRQHEAEEIARVAQTLTGSLDVSDIAQRIVGSVLPVLRGRSSGFRLVQPDGSLMVIAQGQAGGVHAPYGHVVPAGYGVTGRAVADGLPVVTADVLHDSRILLTEEMRSRAETSGLGAFLTVPLRVEGRVIGALSIADRTGRRFTDVETALLQTFADQAALALDHARLYEQTRQRLRHVESIREVVEQILVPFTLEERLNLIARNAAEMFDADLALVGLRAEGEDRLVIRAGHRLVAGELGQSIAMGEGALGLAAAKREGVLVNDYASWSGRMRRMLTPERRDLLGATIAYPLMIRGEVIGALSVAYLGKEERRFVPDDLDRLATLAAPAALAIEHSRLYDELASRVRQLQETQAQLVQAGKLSAVGQLVSGVAHELNNPLSVVIGYGQLLKGKPLPADVRGPLEMMVAQGERMAKIVQGLLLFSRQRKPERAPVDLPAVIEQTMTLRATRLRLSGIRFELDHAPGVPPAEGDVHQLQQVFLNLLLNAEHAIMTGGAGDTIRVRARERTESGRSWVVVEFEDNGSGIAPEVMPRIFEPFFTTKKVGEGTGLGLSVSYGIVQQHGGRLTVESVPGRTVFTVELPSAAQAEPARQTVSPLQAGVYGFGRRALVVDDEPGMVDLVMALLKDTGWQVEVASTGRSALERVRAARFDVVLTDIRMPDGSGEDFYRAVVREQPALAKRFVFMTGDTANPSAWQFLEAEQVPVLEKPFTADSLFRVLEQVTTLTSRGAFE